MAKASEQFRQSDVTVWGLVALVCGASAVLSANLSYALPVSWLSALHASRQQASSLVQLRDQIANLEAETARLREANAMLATRFSLAEDSAETITQRLGALEVSLPNLMENIPPAPPVDPATLTAAIESTPTVTMEVEGGSAEISQQPLPAAQSPELAQPLPDLPLEDLAAAPQPPMQQEQFAIALGEAVSREQARQRWDEIAARVGPLLLGLEPLLAQAPEGEGQQIVAGPFENIAEATESCTRFAQIGISCLPAPFAGEPLP